LEARGQFLCIWNTFKNGKFDLFIFCFDERMPIFGYPIVHEEYIASIEPTFSYVSVFYKGFVHCNSFIIIVSLC
jgi:hypothetical protein